MSGEEVSVENAAFVTVKGRRMKMDLTEMQGEYEKEKIYSFLSLSWAVIADCDINSEVLRCLGKPRFTIWGVFRVFCKRLYRASLNFSGFRVEDKFDIDPANHEMTPAIPKFEEEIPEFNR